jgi:hypothetical protein
MFLHLCLHILYISKMLATSPNRSPFSLSIYRPATFSFVLFRSGPVLSFEPKHAWAVALCVMVDRQRLLGDSYIPKHA